ncbi:uncharacterized protein A4U43_C06F3240 [Asparagus officinalis]|uniref:Uncharacterized protein n=1 Tax=Asparagus officinalis TaxID=4686 RepID=A0A5P1EMI1_ASPOF|nr:uncharacterized protein A4U43_C06F3240 [Asparagus officinalis]
MLLVYLLEYGVRTVSAKYIMKCDDDTFVRIDSVMKEVNKIPKGASLYVGDINYYQKSLRSGKWAVTYEHIIPGQTSCIGPNPHVLNSMIASCRGSCNVV